MLIHEGLQPRRWPDGRSRGFGYVTFSEAESPRMLTALTPATELSP